MDTYRVTAPYITLKVRDLAGALVLNEFYRNAPIPDTADPADRDRLVAKGMIEKIAAPKAETKTEPKVETKEPKAPAVAVPAGNASRDEWAAYAASKGAPAKETKPVDEGGLSRDDLRAKYGA